MTPGVLDVTVAQKVSYCVPAWLRDQNIKHACKRAGVGRIAPHYGERADPIAVVGFGPSLQDTWEQIRDFRYVMTCSGSHKFLVERGIVPFYHVEVDPRPHKVELIGPPQPETEYLIASACSPKVFDHLQGFNVKLWHVFDPSESGHRLLPAGEWSVTGGCDVGMRALTLAAFIGFRELHVFGMDGCARQGRRHAAAHPHTPSKYNTVEYRGVTYDTTPAMLEAARQVAHELNQMPKVHATFYGEGLIQAMMRDYTPTPVEHKKQSLSDAIAILKPELISAEYRALNARLHEENFAYGVGGAKHAPTVLKLCEALKTTSVLDYGAGKGLLANDLPFPIWEYDPAIPEKAHEPRPADIVVCTDVLEHIEPDRLTFVLADLARCCRKVGYFVIHTGPAAKFLADGRNTHLNQHGEEWWRKRLAQFFTVGKITKKGPELFVVVGKKGGKK